MRAFAKLAAEVLYHGPYRPRMPGVSGAPQRLQQVIMGHDAAGVDRKLAEQPVLTSKSSSAPVGDRGTKPNSSMVSRLSSRLSCLAPSGPLYLVFTGATPRRGYPGGVLRQHGTAGPPGLPHGRGVRRPWLETALFTAS